MVLKKYMIGGVLGFLLTSLTPVAANAIDFEKVKDQVLPKQGEVEQSDICVSVMMLTAFLLKNPESGSTPQVQARYEDGAKLWLDEAIKRRNVKTPEEKQAYVKLMIANEHAWQDQNYQT
ncbi:hypothetical protein MMA231_01599 [Asticcacaulis sp. MM231]|uniref:hypothetical protein n=1 Tax=Asticcacaulis sp. MM231 TaxID=3157666 RepID=UPI0032D57BCD